MSDVPDFYLRGEVIREIKKVGEILKITEISKINPTDELNVVVNKIDEIAKIVKINPTDVENVVVDRIEKITEISKINPTVTENVVIDRLDTLTTLKTLEKINLIKSIGEVGTVAVHPTLLRNPSFETGDLTGWGVRGTVTVVAEPAYEGAYACKLAVDSEVYQTARPLICENVWLTFLGKAEVAGDVIRVAWLDTDGVWRTYEASLELAYKLFSFPLTGKARLVQISFIAPGTNAGNVYLDSILTRVKGVYDVLGRPVEVQPFDVSATAAGNVEVWAPLVGYAIKLVGFSYESDADVEVGLRFTTTGPLFGRRTTKGVMAFNLVGCNVQGGIDASIYLYTGGAVTVKGTLYGHYVKTA